MKNKDIKKIVCKLEKTIQDSINERLGYAKSSAKISQSYEDFKICDYDKEVSDKFKALVLNLINYSENLNIYISEDNITINSDDIKKIKNKTYSTSNTSKLTTNSESFMEIKIRKDHYFINRGYNKTSTYRDTEMFDFFLPIIKEKLLEINRENFNEIWNDVMLNSGMIRDNNLDNLLG